MKFRFGKFESLQEKNSKIAKLIKAKCLFYNLRVICEDRGYQRKVDKTALFSFSFLFLFFTKTIFLSCLFALNYVKMSKQFDCYILITIFFLFCFSGFLCGFPSSKITLKSDS